MRDVKIPNWLNRLPLAPEFRPTDTEFADPIAYISKIEKEASAFGICKVIPPLPRPSKKYVLSNLNKSLSKCPELGSDANLSNVCSMQKLGTGDKGNNDGEVRAVFTTRQQELGQSGKRTKGVQKNQNQPPLHKQVWQSGEIYTLEQFESKSKIFARSQLGTVREVSPSVIEALFWKAASEKPIYVEYANDVPGSGFGEPERSSRSFRCLRRRTTFNRYSQGGSENKKGQKDTVSSNDENKGESNEFNLISTATTCSPRVSPDNSSLLSRRKSSGPGNEMEGTSGWKLSNSPWNLQVIARSPGSLTRFMPDDIPGVTSPMVYIGMLFSWFAWHVEDHELHSLNFLHTGSSKTWYSVPGDYAFTFEEVVRTQAYGGNIDRLAALTLLGEKTTLLSPEAVVASGIPCCRLVQNPGEFVVTFPRAYHVGFSHGFNCGEAANFGTPKWLTVAKEAAVRRAAMNHLPMLSHQQLLYLLTMSFVSRVPRFLLPGVRSSRLRDRQKEERELLVKKAFIEDILNENNMLTYLLKKKSSYQAVLWDLESLPSSIKGSDCIGVAVTATPSVDVNTKTDDNQQIFSQSLYMESLNDYDVDDDDLSCNFQVDSGALPCVACGVLGFPFMSVIQPSKEASTDILSSNHHMVQDRGVSHLAESNIPLVLNGMVDVSNSDGMDNKVLALKEIIFSACERTNTVSTTLKSGGEINFTKDCAQSSANAKSFSSDTADEMRPSSKFVQHPNEAYSTQETSQSLLCMAENRYLVPDVSPPNDLPISLRTKLDEGSNTYLRPRIFCLEHAIQVEELLHSKGGANVLVICHSDFQKIKAHAAAVADEIGSPFNYQEIPLDNASPGDLNLINLAIDDEEQNYCGEDWTSKVKINLQHCIKLQKKFPSEKLQHALTLDGLFFDTAPSTSALSFKWRSRKCRSKRRKLNQSDQINSSESTPIKKDEALVAKSDVQVAEKNVEMIQYSRRRFKSKYSCSTGASKTSGDPRKLIEPVGCADPDKNSRNMIAADPSKNENAGIVSPVRGMLVSSEASDQQKENMCSVTPRKCDEISVISEVADSPRVGVQIAENIQVVRENQIAEEISSENEICEIETTDDNVGRHNIQDCGDALTEEVSGSQMQHRIKVVEKSSERNERFYSETAAGSPLIAVQSAENVLVERENQTEEISSENEILDPETADHNSGQNNIQYNGDALMKEVSDSQMQHGINVTGGNTEKNEKCYSETSLGSLKVAVQTSEMIQVETEIQIPENNSSENDIYDTETAGDNGVQHNIQDNGDALTKVVSDHTTSEVSCADNISVGSSDEQTEKSVVENFCTNEACDTANLDCVQLDINTTNDANNMHTHASRNDTLASASSPVSAEESLEVPTEICAAEKMHSADEKCSLQDQREFDRSNSESQPRSVARNARKRKREADLLAEDGSVFDGFIKSPCEGLRPRASKDKTDIDTKRTVEKPVTKKLRNSLDGPNNRKNKKENKEASHKCDLEGCRLSFQTKAEFLLHKRNWCHHEGCGKKFSSHKNAVRHLRVHEDDRPLKCPWKGCTKSFKWAWARTEHIRVHTGEKPYKCKVEGCGLTFRFVSDYSRHRRKTGHYVNVQA